MMLILVPHSAPIVLACEQSLRELELLGHTVRRVAGFSAIDFGRSLLVSQALRDGFDEILFIDSDIGFQPTDVELIRECPEPIVCGLYPKKGVRQFACEFFPDTKSIRFGRSGGLMEVRYAGCGFLLIRRSALEAIQKHHQLPETNQRFGENVTPFFLPMVVDDSPHGQRYLAEDYAYCERARQAGLPILADTRIRLQHIGTYGYTWEDAGR